MYIFLSSAFLLHCAPSLDSSSDSVAFLYGFLRSFLLLSDFALTPASGFYGERYRDGSPSNIADRSEYPSSLFLVQPCDVRFFRGHSLPRLSSFRVHQRRVPLPLLVSCF
ncbi:hypothetical protein IW261DRAFT_1473553 [Armillaria novae-zelandiae]|uniref:Secreted protein n=1 Tax=Armillaria novae-zelandiae TaxID=153914 RepID=A0AA39PAI4_9AGAR|nr:hypothetical protein IW261DRAFT_1473553 [Armillaria novae-zelandiae]